MVPGPQPDHDLAPLLATVLTAAHPLVGPPAHDLIDSVPHEGLVASMRAAVASLIADLDTDTANVLLTLARMWHTSDNGTIVGKDEAASWALDRLPRSLRSPLDHARAVYIGEEDASFAQISTSAISTAQHLAALIGR